MKQLRRGDVRRILEGDKNLQGYDLSGIDLTGVDLTGANLQGSRLDGANLSRVYLERANLRMVTLESTNLQMARLPWADLTDANLRNANLQQAFMPRAILVRANLQFANLRFATLDAVDMSNADLHGAELRGADIVGANLNGARVTASQLATVNVGGGSIFSPPNRSSNTNSARSDSAISSRGTITPARRMDTSEALSILHHARRTDGVPLYSPDSRDALITLASQDNTAEDVLYVFSRWIEFGNYMSHFDDEIGRQNKREFVAVHYPTIIRTYASWAERSLPALEFLTDQACEKSAWDERRGYFEVFFAMNPKRALPQTKECVDRLLARFANYTVPDERSRYVRRLKEFRKNLPNVGFWERLFS